MQKHKAMEGSLVRGCKGRKDQEKENQCPLEQSMKLRESPRRIYPSFTQMTWEFQDLLRKILSRQVGSLLKLTLFALPLVQYQSLKV
jgi:hypothetical protein